MSRVITSGSIFFPSGSTSELYSSIVDAFNILPGDLLRIGPFSDFRSRYYEIKQVTSGSVLQANVPKSGIKAKIVSSLQIDGDTNDPKSAIAVPEYEEGFTETRTILDAIWNSEGRKIFNVTGTGNTAIDVQYEMQSKLVREETISGNKYNIIYYRISNNNNPAAPSNYGNFVVSDGSLTFSGNPYSISTIASTPFVYTLKLDRDILNLINISYNFAILRLKPDETSVIINHKKNFGEVSQTILIPQDASATLKESVGDIFKQLNLDLSNQNI
jgi:hypothetical protein